MSKALFSILLASVLFLPLTAHADTIDDFVFTGAGNTLTFSLPASPANVFVPGGGADNGFEISAEVDFNNSTSEQEIQFTSGNLAFAPAGAYFASLDGNLDIVGALLYSGTSAEPTFLTGTFNLHDLKGAEPPYLLTITPETASTPEPSTLALFLTGASGLLTFKRSKRRPA